MRIGKWVRVYDNTLSIPYPMSVAFGLHGDSEVHIAPILAGKVGVLPELIISPVPVKFWKSACRFSARISHHPGALCVATAVLVNMKVNILITEACGTYQEKAHWDAICDTSRCEDYEGILGKSSKKDMWENMDRFLARLNSRLTREIAEIDKSGEAFLAPPESHAQFSDLTGLNDVAWLVDREAAQTVSSNMGAVQVPRGIAGQVNRALGKDGFTLPKYAVLTGNTEQRYCRLQFLINYNELFQATVDYEEDVDGDEGIGVLHQLTRVLYQRSEGRLNLLNCATHRIPPHRQRARHRIEIIGQWPGHTVEGVTQAVQSVVVHDLAGRPQQENLTLQCYRTPDTIRPRVFISYSTQYGRRELDTLRASLEASDWEPVLGTDLLPGELSTGMVPSVVERAFGVIPTCVASIGLHMARDDYKCGDKYLLAPWAIAEEVYALSRGIYLFRIIDSKLADYDYSYYHDVQKAHFVAGDPGSFAEATDSVIGYLEVLRASPAFEAASRRAESNLFALKGGPGIGTHR